MTIQQQHAGAMVVKITVLTKLQLQKVTKTLFKKSDPVEIISNFSTFSTFYHSVVQIADMQMYLFNWNMRDKKKSDSKRFGF